MDDVAFARALHVIAVIHGIGGLAFVTLVPLPRARSRGGVQGAALLKRAQARERRLGTQPPASLLNIGRMHLVLLAGTGLTARGAVPLAHRLFRP